jgi:hypothetical protein
MRKGQFHENFYRTKQATNWFCHVRRAYTKGAKLSCCDVAMVGACNKFGIAHIHVHVQYIVHIRDRTQAKTSLEPKTVSTCIWLLYGGGGCYMVYV